MIDEKALGERSQEQEGSERQISDFFEHVPVLGKALLKGFITDDEYLNETKLGAQRADIAGFSVPEIIQGIREAEREAGLIEKLSA